MAWLFNDLRFAIRRAIRQPGFTLVVVLTLAMGLGANTAVFTLIDGLLLRALPVEKPEQLYRLGDTNNCCVNSGLQTRWSLFSAGLVDHLRQSAPEFSELAAFQANAQPVGVRRSGNALPETFPSQFVSGNYFRLFGVTPAAGRLLTPDDDRAGAPPVVVLSYAAWTRFGLDPSVVGSTATLNGLPMTIVGITEPAFFGDTIRPDPSGVWMALAQEPAARGDASILARDDQHWLYAIGRLENAALVPTLTTHLTVALQQWLGGQPFVSNDDRRQLALQQLVVTPAGGGVTLVQNQFSQSLTILFLTSAVLLLIACANLANLLLARADRGQAAIRVALGASGSRLMRQSMVEGVVLALAGGGGGVLIAIVVTRALIALAFPGVAEVPVSATPSPTVLLFSVALAVLTGVLFTVAPAWAMSKAAPLEALAGVGRNVHHKSFMPRRSLLVTQVALSFAMITSAGLLASSLANLQSQQLGFDPDHRLVVRIDPPASERTQERLWRLFERLRERIAREPGVANVSYALSSPMDGNNWSSGLTIAGRSADPVRADNTSWNRVGPGYFETVNSRLLRGRGFDERDVPGARRVAVVNETFARRFFDKTDPLGATVGIGGPDHAGDFEIVGVVEDVKYTSVTRPVRPMVFIPGFQSGDYTDPTTRNVMLRSMMLRSLVVDLRPGSSNADAGLRAAIAEINQDINVLRVLSLADQVSGNFRIERLLARLSSIYGGLALVLTALGLYGVTAYSVAQRRREIGVRMALGAEQRGIVRTVITGPVLETTAGLAIGLPLAMLVGQALGSQLYGLGGQSPLIWSVTIAILVLTSIVAAAIPARRAASIDPARALRGE